MKFYHRLKPFLDKPVSSLLLLIVFILPFLDGGTSLLARVLVLFAPLPFLLIAIFRKEINIDRLFSWAFFFLLVFVLFVFKSVIGSTNLLFSIPAFFELLGVLLLFCLFYATCRRNSLKIITGFILLAAFLLSLLSFYYFFPQTVKPSEMNLVFATYGHSHLADYLLLAIPFSFALFLQEKKFKRELLWGCLTLFYLVSFVLTFSRGAFFVLPLALLTMYLKVKEINFSKKLTGAIVILIPLAGLILILFFSYLHLNQNQSYLQGDWLLKQFVKTDFSANRPEYWRQAIEGVWTKPWYGYGWGAFEVVALRFQNMTLNWSNLTHNFYLQVLVESGIFAFLFLLAFLVSIFFRVLRILKTVRDNPYFLGGFGAVVATSVHSVIDYDWHFPAVFVTFLFLAGSLLAATPSPGANRSAGPQTPGWAKNLLILGLIIVSLSAFIFGQTLILGEYFYRKGDDKKALAFSPWPPARVRAAGNKIFEQDFATGEKFGLRILKFSSGDPSMNYWLGDKYFYKGDLDKASGYYQKAIENNPLGNSILYLRLGNIYKQQGKNKERDKLYSFLAQQLEKNKIPSRGSRLFAKITYSVGGEYFKEKRGEEAVVWWEKSIEFAPEWSYFHDELASLEDSLGRRDEAKRILVNCLHFEPPKVDCQNQLKKLSGGKNIDPPGSWQEKISQIPD